MAGHSHWSKIKRAKGANDAKRGKVWSKIARKIIIAARNGGDPRDNLALRMKDAEWDEVIQTNLQAVFRLSRAVMRGMMKARWGRIINITSVVGASGNAGQANYAAAKAGEAGAHREHATRDGDCGYSGLSRLGRARRAETGLRRRAQPGRIQRARGRGHD